MNAIMTREGIKNLFNTTVAKIQAMGYLTTLVMVGVALTLGFFAGRRSSRG